MAASRISSLVLGGVLSIVTSIDHRTMLASAWSSVGSQIGKSPAVSGHAACDLEQEGKVFLFGGMMPDRTVTDDVWVYDEGSPSQKWIKVSTNGEGPGPRMYAAAARLKSTVFVVGGWDPEAKGSGGSFKDSVYALDTKSWTWSHFAPLRCGPVSRHTACTVGNKIVVHTYKKGKKGCVTVSEDGYSRTHATTGDVPNGISMCCSAPLGSDKMILFGGSTKTQAMTNAVHVLDTTTFAWTKLESHGATSPAPCASSCIATMRDQHDCSSFVVFGGATIGEKAYQEGSGLRGSDETWLLNIHLDRNVADWTSFLPSHDTKKNPPPRVASSIHNLGKEKNKFLLVGGWNPATAETYDEPWILQ